MSGQLLKQNLSTILEKYSKSFTDKSYSDENNDTDLLMDVFGISPELKRENRQYWGRELGMCWQLLITELARTSCENFAHSTKYGADEPVDLHIGTDAIDTKYRVGSGDSGTIKKFKKYGELLIREGLRPVLLILREDNLDSPITACRNSGWAIYTGEDCYCYVLEKTGFCIKSFLLEHKDYYGIKRPSCSSD